MRPIQKLVEGTEHIKKGNLLHKTVINANNEFGNLADSFNDMVETIKQKNEALSKSLEKVQEADRLKRNFPNRDASV